MDYSILLGFRGKNLEVVTGGFYCFLKNYLKINLFECIRINEIYFLFTQLENLIERHVKVLSFLVSRSEFFQPKSTAKRKGNSVFRCLIH